MQTVNNYDHYRVFYHVAETGNMGKAAEILNVTPSSVTKNIKSLEECLDCQLFVRSTRGVRLTKEGSILYERVKPAFRMILMGEQELGELHALESGIVNIGIITDIMPNILTSDWIVTFREKYPAIKLSTISLSKGDVEYSLNSGDIDLALIGCPVHDGEIVDEGFTGSINIEKLMIIPDVPVAGGRYSYLADSPVTIEELSEVPLLFASDLYSSAYQAYEKKYAEHGMVFEPAIKSCAVGMQVNGVRHGLGYTFIPASSVKKPLRVSEVRQLKITNFEPYIQVLCVGTSRELPLSNAAEEFIRIMRENPDNFDDLFE